MDFSNILFQMYITLLSAIIAGVINSVWCKSKALKSLQIPMDGGKNFMDGKRIFGDHKTWKGFVGYIVCNMVCMVLWGLVCSATGLETYNMFYAGTANTVLTNLWIGFLLGIFYGIFELPNSFVKRRLGITPGKSLSGWMKVIFVFMDQADSVFGCVIVVCFYAPMSIGFYFLYVVVGAVTHILINMLLYVCKLRKNMF